MRIFEMFEEKVSHRLAKSRKLMDRFITLPWYLKLFIAPLALLLFFLVIFPILIIAGILYKLLLYLSETITYIISNKNIIITSILFFALSIIILVISQFLLSIFLFVCIEVFPFLPDIVLKLLSVIIAPYLIFFFLFNNNESLNDLKTSMKTLHESDFEIEAAKEIIDEASGSKASSNPLLLFMRSPFTIMIFSTLTFGMAMFAVLICSVIINLAFPDVFFKPYEGTLSQLQYWLQYLFDQLIIIIPVDILGPFLPETSAKLVQQPWGSLLSIFFQIFLAYMIYLYISAIFMSAKFYIHKKHKSKVIYQEAV